MENIKFTYVPATTEKLIEIWDKTIASHPGDGRWVEWKQNALEDNASGRSLTFLVLADDRPVGEGTLLFSEDCGAVVDLSGVVVAGKATNINGLRIEKAFEGQGHISRLVREMEKYAGEHGYERITIGVDAKETRNIAIYLHWGYTQFITHEIEEDQPVLYYGKPLV